jgi:glycerol-3-phosphate dehydrogenase (NAD(P)+)
MPQAKPKQVDPMSGQKRILIIGHGEMGMAMSHLLKRHAPSVWERQPKDGRMALDLGLAAADAEIIIFCVPAAAHAELAANVAPRLAASACCVSIAKGLDDQGRCAWRIFHDTLPGKAHYAVMYGPMISEEIRAGKPAFSDVATSSPGDFQVLRELFVGGPLHLQESTDPLGISWCAILKNIYAIAFGIADALGLGDNLRGQLSVAAVEEMAAISVHLSGRPETAYRRAGLGDLITTATSAGSHHHALGGLLLRGEFDRVRGEGVHSLEVMHALRLLNVGCHPLFDLLADILRDPRTTRRRFEDYVQAL